MATKRVLCFVPLKEEMSHINSKLVERGAAYQYGEFDEKRDEHFYTVPLRGDADFFEVKFFVLTGMGNVSSASTVLSKITQAQFHADVNILMGIAGTIDIDDVKLGDVVISSAVKYIAPDKIQAIDSATFYPDQIKRVCTNSWFRFKRDAIEFNPSRDKIARYLKRIGSINLLPVDKDVFDGNDEQSAEYFNVKPTVRTGFVLGSEWVVDSAEFVSFLNQRNSSDADDWYSKHGDEEDKKRNNWIRGKIACLDMESYGFFSAMSEYRKSYIYPHAFSIRGISDPCRDKKSLEKSSRERVRKIAIHNAVEVMVDFIFYMMLNDIAASSN